MKYKQPSSIQLAVSLKLYLKVFKGLKPLLLFIFLSFQFPTFASFITLVHLFIHSLTMYFTSLVGFGLAAGSAAALTNGTAIIPAVDNSPASVSQVTPVVPAVATSAAIGAQSVASIDSVFNTVLTSFITIASSTTTQTQTVLITPLPSSEAKKQEVAFSKAQRQSNSVAAQVSQAFTAQGKAVPSALVPAQPKQTEIKHSGLEDIVNIIQNTDYSQHVAASPENGEFYIMFFNGTNTTEADEYAQGHHARLPHTISNPSKQGMCILGHAMNLNTMKATPFAFKNTKVPQLYIGPNSTVQVGNFIPETRDHGNNGRIQARFNCDKDCQKCAGDNVGPVVTLFEFNHINRVDGTIMSYFNPSNGMSTFTRLGNTSNMNSRRIPRQLQRYCLQQQRWCLPSSSMQYYRRASQEDLPQD
jgi:hypothetical protein